MTKSLLKAMAPILAILVAGLATRTFAFEPASRCAQLYSIPFQIGRPVSTGITIAVLADLHTGSLFTGRCAR
jgi:hypothetical protein